MDNNVQIMWTFVCTRFLVTTEQNRIKFVPAEGVLVQRGLILFSCVPLEQEIFRCDNLSLHPHYFSMWSIQIPLGSRTTKIFGWMKGPKAGKCVRFMFDSNIDFPTSFRSLDPKTGWHIIFWIYS